MTKVEVIGLKGEGRDIVLENKRVSVCKLCCQGKVCKREITKAKACLIAEEIIFIRFPYPGYRQLINKYGSVKVQVFNLPGAHVQEHMRIHIVNS